MICFPRFSANAEAYAVDGPTTMPSLDLPWVLNIFTDFVDNPNVTLGCGVIVCLFECDEYGLVARRNKAILIYNIFKFSILIFVHEFDFIPIIYSSASGKVISWQSSGVGSIGTAGVLGRHKLRRRSVKEMSGIHVEFFDSGNHEIVRQAKCGDT